MAVDPLNPPCAEDVIFGQFADYTQFPPILELQAGYCAWAENTNGLFLKGLYIVLWVNNIQHQWQYIGPGAGGGTLPDIRFVVGKLPYNLLAPGTATYSSIASALIAVAAYQLATGGLPVTIFLHPDTYAESPTLPEGVSLVGLTSAARAVHVAGTVTATVGGAHDSGLSLLRCDDCVVNFPSPSVRRCDIQRVDVTGSLTVAQAAGAGTSQVVLFDANIESSASFSGDSLIVTTFQGRLHRTVATSPLGFVNVLCNGTFLTGGGVVPFIASGPGSAGGVFANCIWDTSDPLLPIVRLSDGASVQITGGKRLSPCSGFLATSPDGTGRAWIQNLSGTSDAADQSAGVDPSLAISASLPTADGHPGQTVTITVTGGAFVPQYDVERATDTTEVLVAQVVAIDTTRALNAFALVKVPPSAEVIDFRRLVIFNASDISAPGTGPLALIPSGADLIGGLAGAAPVITSADYVIVGPGDSVELSRTAGGWRLL